MTKEERDVQVGNRGIARFAEEIRIERERESR